MRFVDDPKDAPKSSRAAEPGLQFAILLPGDTFGDSASTIVKSVRSIFKGDLEEQIQIRDWRRLPADVKTGFDG
jgi:hypothetical protein